MPTPALSDADIASALASLPGWSYDAAERKLKRAWRFKDFREAFAFLTRVAFEAEAQGHHPEIFNCWASVELKLNTHDAGGKVTAKDVALAWAVSGMAA
jgi:4a-hydroxytetrahydrobiopterin dehydratase